ncbi:MAG: LTA synthase family protein [Bacteroidota bacterium]|nr:MAG: LTA synthase family protein [Bacteroidota bacterium]
MVNTPVTSLAQSEHNSVSYSSSVALPFRNSGYETTFITGGKFGWRNINEFIPHQYFQHVESKDNVLKEIAGSTECEWGVYDEYLFDYVFKKLEKATKPQMIFVLTTTNHTPFHLPETYRPYPIKLTNEINSKLLTDENLAVKNLTNLQYSNDCLGKFMDKVKHSNLSQNTIVAATGDHNNLMLFDFNESQMYYQRSVPLYMYVPETIHPHVAINKWGSHKDIFPTLINLALPQSTYFNAGDNLFDTLQSRNNIFATDWMSMEAMNEFGAVKYGESVKYFDWDKNKMLKETATPSADLQKLLQRARRHYAAMAYFIRSETLKTKQGK